MIWKALFSVIGAGSFFFILNQYGFGKIAHDLSGLGWWAIPLALSFAPVAFLYGLAWFLVTPALPLRRLPAMLPLSAISLAWNNLSPFVKVLGEPMRVNLLDGWIPRKAAIESAVIYNLAHILGTLLAFVIGAVVILCVYPVDETIHYSFIGIGIAAFALLLGVYYLPQFAGHKRRRRKPGVKPSFFAKARFYLRWSFSKMRMFSRRYPARFYAAVLVETLVRFVEGITFYVAFKSMRAPVSVLSASLLDVGRALLDNAFFFIPYQVGSREGGILLIARNVLHIEDSSVVSATVFYRLVEIFWMALGYLMWLAIQRGSSRKSPT